MADDETDSLAERMQREVYANETSGDGEDDPNILRTEMILALEGAEGELERARSFLARMNMPTGWVSSLLDTIGNRLEEFTD